MRMIAIAALMLAGCAGKTPPPEPIIQTIEVKVPVAVPCDAADKIGAAPAYPDSDGALAAAADLYERVQRLLAGRTLRITREAALEAALNACR